MLSLIAICNSVEINKCCVKYTYRKHQNTYKEFINVHLLYYYSVKYRISHNFWNKVNITRINSNKNLKLKMF